MSLIQTFRNVSDSIGLNNGNGPQLQPQMNGQMNGTMNGMGTGTQPSIFAGNNNFPKLPLGNSPFSSDNGNGNGNGMNMGNQSFGQRQMGQSSPFQQTQDQLNFMNMGSNQLYPNNNQGGLLQLGSGSQGMNQGQNQGQMQMQPNGNGNNYQIPNMNANGGNGISNIPMNANSNGNGNAGGNQNNGNKTAAPGQKPKTGPFGLPQMAFPILLVFIIAVLFLMFKNKLPFFKKKKDKDANEDEIQEDEKPDKLQKPKTPQHGAKTPRHPIALDPNADHSYQEELAERRMQQEEARMQQEEARRRQYAIQQRQQQDAIARQRMSSGQDPYAPVTPRGVQDYGTQFQNPPPQQQQHVQPQQQQGRPQGEYQPMNALPLVGGNDGGRRGNGNGNGNAGYPGDQQQQQEEPSHYPAYPQDNRFNPTNQTRDQNQQNWRAPDPAQFQMNGNIPYDYDPNRQGQQQQRQPDQRMQQPQPPQRNPNEYYQNPNYPAMGTKPQPSQQQTPSHSMQGGSTRDLPPQQGQDPYQHGGYPPPLPQNSQRQIENYPQDQNYQQGFQGQLPPNQQGQVNPNYPPNSQIPPNHQQQQEFQGNPQDFQSNQGGQPMQRFQDNQQQQQPPPNRQLSAVPRRQDQGNGQPPMGNQRPPQQQQQNGVNPQGFVVPLKSQ